MTGQSVRSGSEQLYVVGPVWHIVDGAGANGPVVGPIYPFRCFRWMLVRRAERRGLHRGEPPPDAPVCGNCIRFGVEPNEAGAADGEGDQDALDEW